MALSKEQKILNKLDKLYDLDYVISTNHNLTEDQLKHIQNYTHKRTCGETILEYRKPKDFQQLYDMICDCLSHGKKTNLEKFVSMYGDELGKQKYEETNVTKAITLKKMIEMYGDEEGQVRWKSYCDKQAVSNTFEYKQEKHGMTKEEFDEYNKSRSVTLDNLTNRHGKEKGTQVYNAYVEKQRVAGITREYFVETYGEKDGMEKYVNMLIAKSTTGGFIKASKRSNDFLDKFENDINCQTSNREFPLYDYDSDVAFVYDFVDHDLKLCIEFNGVYWHMKPSMYESYDVNSTKSMKASQIWERDATKKVAFLKQHPDYQYVTVWEDDAYIDWKNNCKSYLNETYLSDLINQIKSNTVECV